MKKIFMAAILCCATTVVNAQNTVEESKKIAEQMLTVKRFEEFINKK